MWRGLWGEPEYTRLSQVEIDYLIFVSLGSRVNVTFYDIHFLYFSLHMKM